jgi:hypothetical protein
MKSKSKQQKSRRPQDKPQTALRIAERRTRLLQLFRAGKSTREASKVLKSEGYGRGSSQPTVAKDLVAMRADFAARVPEEREQTYRELKGYKEIVAAAEDMGTGEQIKLLLEVQDRLSRLLGLDAPTKSVSATVSANAGGPAEAFEFLRHSHGLSEEQLAEVYAFMDQLPRKPLVIDASSFTEDEPAGESGGTDES